MNLARDDSQRPTKVMRMVGMSRKDYEIVWTEQGGLCAICGKEETGRHQSGTLKRLAVDHDHATGRFRGLLCCECNKKLAKLEDDDHFVSPAQIYLERTRNAIS